MKAKSQPTPSQPAVVVDSEVVRKIRQHARSCNTTEVCGILIGQDRDHRVEVAACIEGENAEGAGAHVTFTQSTWEHIYAVKDKKFPNERIVGWYHSHPGFGIFLSEHDTFIHKNFFSSPGQLAWVFDPHSDEEGCFGWVEGRIERLKRIGVLDRRGGEVAESGAEPEPATHVARRGNVSDEPQQDDPKKSSLTATPVRIRRSQVDDGSDEGALSLEQLVAKVFLGLALLALGGVFSWYFFPHLVVVPVAVDPITGVPIDPQAAQILEQLQADKGGKADPAKTTPEKTLPSPASDANDQKGKDPNAK
jgi:proteasome lid subunit RPN8/RPN11